VNRAFRCGSFFTLALLFFGGGSHTFAGCKGLSAEGVGTRLGTAVLEIARAFVRAGTWNNPDCHSPESREARDLCSLSSELENAVERINKAVDRGCIDEAGEYARSADVHAFSVLKTALSSSDSRLRWQVLMRMYLLCEDASMLTEAGAKGCGQEVEGGALDVLREDREPFNRHLALEILGSRLVTERSRESLQAVVRTQQDLPGVCPHGFLSANTTPGNHLPWDSIASGFDRSKYRCEQQLAREALARLDHE